MLTGRVKQAGPGRPSWCYGTPGIARAQQITAIATGGTAGGGSSANTPCWRLRIKPGPSVDLARVEIALGAILDELTRDGVISHWRHILYEPETPAFGGQTALTIAHDLSAPDSSNILAYLRHPEPPVARRELSVLLCMAGDRFHTLVYQRTGGLPA